MQWAPDLLQAALDAGQIQVADIDTALERRYVQMFKYGIFDRPLVQTPIDYAAGGETRPRDRRSGRPSCCRTTARCRFDTVRQDVVVDR